MMSAICQTFLAFLGSIGYSFLFNVRGKKMVASAIGGAVTWIVYLVILQISDDRVVAVFAGTLMAAVLSEILARLMKGPVIILLVPMLIPLIPGSDLYYATYYLVSDHTVEFAKALRLVIEEAGAIAFGIILVTCIVQVIMKVGNHVKAMTKQTKD